MESPDAVGRSTRYSATLEENTMYVAVASFQGGAPVVVVRTSIPVTSVERKLDLIDRNIIVAGFVAVVLITAISPWFSFRTGSKRSPVAK
jgi:hypothetical protein